MVGELRCRRGLLFHAWQCGVNAGPARSTRCPNGHRGACMTRIIKGPNPNKDQMRSRLSLTKEGSTAVRAKPAVHTIAAICNTREVARLSNDFECRGVKASANRSAACAQVLTIPTPAHACDDRRLLAFPANRAAKAPASHCHYTLQGQGRTNRAFQIVSLRRRESALPPNPSFHTDVLRLAAPVLAFG
jgi:hypothetical protein